MRQVLPYAIIAGTAVVLTAASAADRQPDPTMSFFITSVGTGDGANLGGLAGADRHCATLAEAAGVRGKEWRAYLSAAPQGGQPAVHARDRIGRGPWHNAKGVLIATDLEQLHSEAAQTGKANSLNEKGEPVNGRGDTPNMHDILTGSNPDGTLAVDTLDTTCSNFTSNAATGRAMVGHHDRIGGGVRPTSWNSAHPSRGCGQANLVATGGNGLFYCFAR
jgi:hypothetical protein